jgi:DNA repair protein RecN (Recombination protein N)
VLAWAAEAAPRLLELDGDEDRTSELHAQREQLRAALAGHAAELTRRRTDAAAALGDAVCAELTDLSMPDARLVVEVRRREDPDGLAVDLGDREGDGTSNRSVRYAAGPDGIDEVEFLLVPHPGAPARPIARGASGGELSRVMLGLEVVLAAADPVPTFVFDEVDAGVGGRAALGIGRRLARLARTSQVLVVTHLAQVAAFADRHLTVVKSSDGEVTVSGVTALDTPGRVRELARMLGGMADSGTAQAHAQELLETAEQERTAGAEQPARRPGQRGRAGARQTGERSTTASQRSVGPSCGEDAPATAPTRP